jgi:hypothetical protein
MDIPRYQVNITLLGEEAEVWLMRSFFIDIESLMLHMCLPRLRPVVR